METIESYKSIIVTMTDGSRWRLAAEIIAANRANHYQSYGWKEEFEFAMGDESELIDWAANNMNWSDVAEYASRFEDAEPPDFQEGWMNGEKEIRNHEISLPVPTEVAEKLKKYGV